MGVGEEDVPTGIFYRLDWRAIRMARVGRLGGVLTAPNFTDLSRACLHLLSLCLPIVPLYRTTSTALFLLASGWELKTVQPAEWRGVHVWLIWWRF